MSVGVLKVGALTLNENYTIADATNAQSGVRTVNISGIEHYPGRTLEQVRALADDLTSMYGKTVPVVFQHKTDRSGYYTIEDVNTSAVHWDGHASGFTWSLGLTRIGPDNAVDIESRLTHVVRANDFTVTGERWHAPPIGHHTYYVGAVTPATVVRSTETGPITVYRAIPAVSPRYGCPVGSFLSGRVRFLSGGIERTGQGILLPPNDWELNNGLVRVKPSPGVVNFTTLLVAVWDGAAWQERSWDIRIAGDSLRPDVDFASVTLLRNDPEVVSMRILAKQPSNGQRNLVDLVLRRGSRILEGYVQRTVSGQISVQLDVAETWVDNGSYTVASGPDAQGLRWAAGSSKFFSLATNGGVSLSNSVTLDFWLGAEVPKPSAGGSNPGFETGAVSPWFGTNGTVTIRSDTPKHGTYYGRVTATAAATDLRIDHSESATLGTAAKSYTISGWIRSPVAVAAGQAFATMHWYNGAVYMSSSGFAAPALVANVWTPVSGTAVAPANTTNIGRQASLLGGVVSVGTILDVDSLHVREAIDSGDAITTLRDHYMAAPIEATMAVAR